MTANLWQLFLSFMQVGMFSIGGGYAAMPFIRSQVVSEKLVSQAIAEGSVRTVPIENEPFCRTHHIVYHRHKFLTQSAREFIALCHEMEASADVMEP